jgi:hypothetical protein
VTKLALLAIALSATGCLSIEAEIEGTCISRKDVEIEAAPNVHTASHAFLIEDMSEVHRLLDFDAELEFVRAEIRPTSGVTSLDFVDAASVAIEGMPVYACEGNCPSTDGIELLTTAKQSATPYLSADMLSVQLEVTGDLPQTAWTADIDVCVKGTASYSL